MPSIKILKVLLIQIRLFGDYAQYDLTARENIWIGDIDAAQVQRLARPLRQNGYGKYLLRMLSEQP